MNQRRSNNYIPDSQRLFIVFSLLFVIAVALILAVNSRFDEASPSNSVSVPSEASKAEESVFSKEENSTGDLSAVPDIEESSETSAGDESTASPAQSGVSEPAVSEGEISDVGTVSEEASEASMPNYEGDLPYDPSKLLELRNEDLQPNELDKYFEDSVFIGNSLVVHFENFYYVMRAKDKNFLGKPEFVCASAFSARIDLLDKEKYGKYYPRVDGQLVHTWEAVAQLKPKTVYYNLMGLNELGLHQYSKTPELTFENNRKVLEKIMQACPGVKIVILSNTYMVESFNGEDKGLNNYNISKFNNLALQWCNENGHDFIDISTPFLDGNVMNDEYCSDANPKGCGCHIKLMYYPSWAAMLRNYAYQKLNGTWKNPESMKILAAGKKVYN